MCDVFSHIVWNSSFSFDETFTKWIFEFWESELKLSECQFTCLLSNIARASHTWMKIMRTVNWVSAAKVLKVKSVHSVAILVMLPGSYFQSYKTRLLSTWMERDSYTRNILGRWHFKHGLAITVKIGQKCQDNMCSLAPITWGKVHFWGCSSYCVGFFF